MIILMDESKKLFKKDVASIFQGESLVDKIHFLIPKIYRETDLSDFTAEVHYTLPGNVERTEKLTLLENSTHEETHLCYLISVNSKITSLAGDVVLYLVFTKEDLQNKKKYVLRTDSTNITVKQVEAPMPLPECDQGGDTECDFDVVEF